MIQKQLRWHQLLSFLAIGGILCVSSHSAIAQLRPIADDTLGNERSIVSPDRVINGLPSNQIDGGARRGANLFHSFREFNSDVGRGVYFTNPAGVANILTRATGGNPSQILGTLGVLGNANLFLLNSNGIVFGPNAQLDVGGSFIASTASSFKFADGSEFSADNPQAPPLLTVNVPIGLQYGSNPGAIQVEGASLQVPNGQTLTLAGGAVTVNGGQLLAPGGRVELAGVAGAGAVGLAQQGQEWRLNVPDGLGRTDVAIGNDAIVNVRSGGGGSIAITARNFRGIGAGTRVRAGIAAGLGTVDAQAGDIDINATEAINLDGIVISNAVAGGTGNAGNLNITTGKLFLTNGARVNSVTGGRGNAGNVTITARDAVSFNGNSSNGLNSGADDGVNPGGIGQGGDLRITTGTLSITNGGVVNANTYGQGNAGNITITARNAVFFDGVGSNGVNSGTFSVVAPGGIGHGGNTSITTGTLSITNGGVVNANTYGQGNAGNITITARDAVSFDGVGSNGVNSGTFSVVAPGAIGHGGNTSITTGTLSITNGGIVDANTSGQGNAGNITITARNAVFFDGVGSNGDPSAAFSSVESGAIGQGGDIRITTDVLSLSNGAQVNAATDASGNAGNITFDALTLNVAGGAQVLATTSSTGNGGSILVNAPASVDLRRVDNLSPVLSVETSGAGKAGDITINTPSLTLAEQSRITATATATATNPQSGGSVTLNASHLNLSGIVGVFAETQGQSPAGTLRLNPYINQPSLNIALTPNSQISASTSGSGTGGDLIATAPQSITIAGPGKLAVETSGTGNAGNINIATQQLTLKDGVEISASTSGVGKAGEIGIKAKAFTLSGGANVSTNTASSGAAGDLTVQVKDQLFLTGQGTGLFASTAPGSTGSGGNIAIDPQQVVIQDGAAIAVNSQGRGIGGNIFLQADRVELNRQGSITAETASAQGGNITLAVNDVLVLRRNSLISATAGTAQAGGDGGNITFNGNFIVAVANENSDISANAFTGSGGRVNINAQGLFGIQFRPQLTPLSDITASSDFGVAGVVVINTPDVDLNRGLVQLPVDLTDASRLIVQTCPTGDSLAKQPNEFIITGRGGLPPTPSEAVNRDAIQVDLVTADAGDRPFVSQRDLTQNSPPLFPSPLVEAQGMQIATDGTVFLVAAAPITVTPALNRLVHCH